MDPPDTRPPGPTPAPAMLRKLLPIAAVAAALVSPAPAQTVRFETSVGAFDMLLNPNGDDNLQPLVDNMLANVASGVYHRAVVNRAVTDFVLQLGSFQTDSVNVSEIPEFGFAGVNSADPVVVDENNDGQVDFDSDTNTRGTVSLALSAAGPNSGSASFFVNLGDNSFLDSQGFVPFAEIADMTVIDRIMSQTIVDLSADVGQNGSLAYTDVPLADDGDLIVIEDATVIQGSSNVFVGPILDRFGSPLASSSPVEDDAVIPDVIDDAGGDDASGGDFNDPFAALTDEQFELLMQDQFADDFLAIASGELDALDWLATLGAAASGATSAPIPEPAAALLAAIGLAAASRRR